ncbi:non-ribosomal peptide synthetase/type I polyketide synthase [Cellulomonas sp. S1-8]|uniref:non-ribosomal peptide synthetase/type I polyketide synthase n=1 Tax=Cellulomonas sp. S1-8 TaxID=2904790 RepID=UPI00224445BC|nr:non-ribosomal peptide synthetase/type I polyketide synthase [Cellulomonas sp. S1-8]UZN02618.1 amino acid adenylation domain-containing protein [Cellulomonas sp. S1-8]
MHVLPMSSSQLGMYFDAQVRNASDYHVAVHLRIAQVLPERFGGAVRRVMAAQPALRSAVRNLRGGVSYVVVPADEVETPVTSHDLRGQDGAQDAFDAIVAEATSAPFDLETAPLFRVVHARFDGEDQAVVVCHHLVADGLSVSYLVEQVMELALGDDDLAADVVEDAGLAVYQEKQTQQPSERKAARNREFWEQSLARQEAPDLSHWLDPTAGDVVGREVRVPVDARLVDALRTCARDAEVSEYTVYLGVFGLLLARYAHTDDVAVSIPFTDRPALEMERSIGCFIRTLPVHVDATATATVRELLGRLHKAVLGSWKHLDHPVTRLLGDHPALARVFDVTFIHDAFSYPEGVHGAVRQDVSAVRQDPVPFPGTLTVILEQVDGATELVFQYKDPVLSEQKIRRFADRYVTLLEQVPTSLDEPAASLRESSAAADAALLAELSQTHFYDWTPTHLGDLFLARTTADPAGIAWSDASREYSNAWAHDAAVVVQRRLLDLTGGEKKRVAVLLPRGAELLAGVFGTALAGSAYVPLSAGTPAERLAQIFRDADIAVVLTTSDADAAFPDGVMRLDIDTIDELVALRDDERVEIGVRPADVDVSPDDVLYIEYTSGSTGVPKGVVITHANIQNTALDLERRFPLRAHDVYLLKTAFTFDIFGTEVYGWLVGAGRLHVLPPGHEGDVLAVVDAIRTAGVTHVNFTPTMLRLLVGAAESGDRAAALASLTYVFSGGEALTADIVERFCALPLTCSLENVYGPTEATMWATHTTITSADTARIAPIGTPLNDYRVYVVARSDALCGVDVPGEVCIAGAGVGVGYLNRDELNAQQFVANPFFDDARDPEHMRRMYRTGDLGHLREDGRFAFIRRIDRQVKVGGVRMELGEIEQALLRTEGVVEAAVVIDDGVVPPRLAGFYTTRASTGASTEPTTADVRAALARTLEPQMIPSVLLAIDALPTSTAGKLDRRALKEQLAAMRAQAGAAPGLPAPGDQAVASPDAQATRGSSARTGTAAPGGTPVTERVAALWRTVLGTSTLDPRASFFEQGGSSLSLMSLQLELKEEFGREVRVTELLKHPTVEAQAGLFEDLEEPSHQEPSETAGTGETAETAAAPTAPAAVPCDIAVIGIGIQVPGASGVHEFWSNLRDGAEGITFYDDDELRALGVPESDIAAPQYVKAAGRLDGVGAFDHTLFRIPPAEADATSPQLRLLYETFWQVCEDAGYDPTALPGRVGVFAGGNDDFAWYQDKVIGADRYGDAYQNFTLATNHFLSTRLSYQFDLTGPSMSALTGCSTSLLTVHLAVQSLRLGECDLAVAGGVTLELPNGGGYHYADGMMFSPDGHCRPFDARAAGTMFSNGAALVMLKPVDAAVRDGDRVYGVIKGSAVGNDGRRKLSYTAPSEDGQCETIRAAYESSGIDPATVSYVEAHGTGTLLGDPIEVASLARAFEGVPAGEVLLGSVKGNVGHTDSAAGSVGLSKVALSLEHRYLPGTRNYADPNPHIDFRSTPFRVTSQGEPWRGRALRAGINSFGVGGTNVHMIVEEGPRAGATQDNAYEVLQFSAASPEALDRTADAVVRHIATHADVSVSDAARTLCQGRAQLTHRKTMVVSAAEPRDAERWAERLRSAPATQARSGARTALLFSGQGNQYHAMGRGLYLSDSPSGVLFRRWMDEVIGHLADDEAAQLRDVLYGPEGDKRIHRTEWSQLALFGSQLAAAKVLEAFGVVPDVLVGHSIGELTAAALAGVWELGDAVRLVRERGRLMQAQEPGVMIAVLAPAAQVRDVIAGMDGVWLSLDNSAMRSVVGMRSEVVDAVVRQLDDAGLLGIPLQTSHAFHTPMMSDAAKAFEEAVAGVTTRDPAVPIISNRTGEVVGPGEMTDPAYWGDHITGEVRFATSLATLLADGPLFGVEIGPGPSLSTFAAHDPGKRHDHVFVHVLKRAAEKDADEAWLLNALGTLWSAGLPVDWTHHTTGRRISLPTYSFDRHPHPVTTTTRVASGGAAAVRPLPASPSADVAGPAGGDVDLVAAVQATFVAVLGYPEVAADADFFALGGDSLKATGLAALLSSRLGVVVTVADVFAATTPAALAERFAPAARAAADGAPSAGVHRLAPAPAQDDYPLSPAQVRMYIAAQLDPAALVYNMASATWLDGTLDPDALRTAVGRLVARHEPLRTTFALRDGGLRQAIADPGTTGPLPLVFSTAAHVGQDVVDGLMDRFVRPFDLGTGPLFRMEVVDGGSSGSLVLFDIHHIVADAVSAEIIARDLGALYAGDLEPLDVHYKDVVVHHDETRARLVAESAAQLLETLRDAPTAALLTTDRPRGAARDGAAGRVKQHLDPARMRSVRVLAEAHDATPFMVLLSAWGATLARTTGRDDLVIGAPVAGRTLAETQEMVGMFVNMMPIRLRPEPTTSFGDYLDASRSAVVDALQHQDVPFDRVVDALGLERVPGRHPLCDVSFDYHNIERHDVAIDGIAARELEVRPAGVAMDLVITCTETADGLAVELDYAAGLFDRATIERLVMCFEALLVAACQDDDLPIGRIPLGTPTDAIRARLVAAPFTPVHELVAQRAAEHPAAVAVIDGNGDRYTFAQLDGMANAQAARLVDAGLRLGEHVALFTRRDVNLLVAQLAILKAGGAYLPIDPEQPVARQERILADAAPRFAFAEPGLAAAPAVGTVFDLTTCTARTAPAPAGRPAGPVVGPDVPAYAVFTSGSTGRPKGIQVKHRGVTNLWHDHAARGIFAPGDVIISLADPTFDIFTFESLLPLASGAAVHMCPVDDQKDAAAIAQRVEAYGVTHIQAPVSKMAALCGNRLFRAQLPALRVVVCGGEHFSENLLALLLQESGARVFNMYGPTETTVTATVKEFAPGDDVTIGSAVSGAAVIVVGEDGTILPAGEPGELCIAGEGLAVGYINDPEKTAAAFTTLRELPGVRVYRTGDAGYLRPDGEIVLSGRLDHQVKVNGNRIELGEIEKTAMRADGVTYAVATVSDGDLVLHYTAQDAADRSAAVLAQIDAALPAYMRPARLRQVAEMPKLPNKKVDRAALEAAAGQTAAPTAPTTPTTTAPATAPTAPAGDVLEVILGVWAEVLGRSVSAGDNFFDVGGSSYKLMLVNNRLGEELERSIPLVRLFENPTPRALAEALGHRAVPATGPGRADSSAGPTAAGPAAAGPPAADETGTIAAVDIMGITEWADQRQHAEAQDPGRKIAVIGMAGVLPGAATVAEYWDNRFAGVDSISRFTRDELLDAGFDEATVDDPRYVNARGYVAADTFDADFFEYSAHEAETMDPQVRLLHETAWHALEDAGYVPGEFPGDIALFAGSGTNFAWMARFLRRKDDPIGAFEAMTMNEKDFLATKVAYKLGLTGPAVNVQTACSTSLVAIHQAVSCLRQGEADMALAGGVALNFPRTEGYTWHEGMIFSADGVCRPFSQDANGTVGGQGVGVVLLKPLDAALADGDHIYAVIAGSATNNDGRAKVGYTAPSVRGQEQVIRSALSDAAVEAEDVIYVETHGTGTVHGDPIEYQALANVYGGSRPVALGAAKANVGHLDAAAGVAGFFGAVGVVHRGIIPPMANFTAMNRGIDAAGSIYVPTRATAPAGGVPFAAVSSFGIGGTNAHVILEPAPVRPEPSDRDDGGECLFPVSARTERSRRRMQDALADFLGAGGPALDVSATLARGRAQFEHRAAAIRVPGGALEWIEPGAHALAIDASDGVRLTLPAGLPDDTSPAGQPFVRALNLVLSVFEDGLRAQVRAALSDVGTPDNPPIDRISQLVVRVAIARFAGPDSLHARVGDDRLLRIALGVATAEISSGEAMGHLRAGTAPERALQAVPEVITPAETGGLVTLDVLRRVLATRWVRGADVDRTLFCADGRRVPAPGYAFEPRPFLSDIRWDDLGLASDVEPPAVTTGLDHEAVRGTWVEVLGSEPTDDADFLRSGGDSLAAVRFTALVEKRTGVAITVGEMFTDASYAAIRTLLTARAAQTQASTPTPPSTDPARPAPAEVVETPASPAQRRMYAVCALRDDDTAYNLAIAYRVTGRLDVERLRDAFRQIVGRHEQLRTSFHLADDGTLVQRVRTEVPDVVRVVTATAAEVEARLAAGPRPFDLTDAPLLRVEILSVRDDLHYLLLDLHHIVGDQTSLGVIADDLSRALRGRSPAAAPLPYADHVAALARLAETGRLDADVEYFATALRGDLPRLQLPADRTPPEPATLDGDRHGLTCTASRRAVTDLARECGATPYMVFLAALTRVLGLYSGQREFLLGTAVSGRHVPGSEHTVGMFVNTLPLRVTDLSDRTVRDAVAAAKDSVAAVLGHQDAPFEAVLARLGIRPGGDANPLFDVLLNYVSTGTEELELDGVRMEPLPHGRVKSRYALSFSVAERTDDLVVDIEYRTEMFDHATIARLGAQLDLLLLAMTQDAGRRVAELPLETPDEHARRRAELTAAGPAITEPLLTRIRESFAEHADLPALRWDGQEWSYADLDRLTDDLAGGLQDAGVRTGDFVLCLLERGPWQVLTRVALMKCGAIEVPLDVDLPDERVAGILADSGAAVVLATAPEAWERPGVVARRPQDLTGTYAPPSDVTADSPLVMIYTSGTTGLPKGTLVTHGGVLSTCSDNGYMDYAPGMRVLHLTGCTFDPSLLDVHSALLAGATLVMGGHEHARDMNLLADLLREERVDAGILITAVFHLLMAERPEAVAGMSALYVGGEAMQPWAAQRAFDVLGAGRLWNLYGPTEASVCTTSFRVDEYPDFARMPIGGPARNRDLYIVHPDGTDVPRGVPGELCVGGPSVALGYHQRPGLTAEKFVDGLAGVAGRVYRTGDRVVLDDAGRIVYLDRIDRQVKHAGYRIELSEIELALQGCPGVSDAVVVHTKDGNDSRLTGFCRAEPTTDGPTEAGLRDQLATRLPRYMVPQRVIVLPEFPLTSHGKVDRARLAARIDAPVGAAGARTAPDAVGSRPVGDVLAVFREVLAAPELAGTADFFAAGGQSLQAIAVVRRLRESGAELQVSDLYRHPTADALRAFLQPEPPAGAQPEPADRGGEPRRAVSADQFRRIVSWAAHDAHRVAESYAGEPAAHGFDIGALARLHRASGTETGGFIQTVTGVDVEDLRDGIGRTVVRHESLRARLVGDSFEIVGPDAFGDLSGLIAVQDARRIDRDQVAALVGDLAHALQAQPFTDGLLWRCVVVRVSDDELRLVWAFHHAVFDGFSAGILRDETVRAARGVELPAPRQFGAYLAALADAPDWRGGLEGFDHADWLAANLRAGHAVAGEPAASRAPVQRYSFPLVGGENPLDAAFAVLHAQLARHSGGDRVAIGFVTSSRRWAGQDWSDCVGEFLDVVPVLLTGDGDQAAVADRLARAQRSGLNFVSALAAEPEGLGEAGPLRAEDLHALRAAYWNDLGKLDLTLVNFQGHIPADEMPEVSPSGGPGLARTHINVWHDDDALHVEWISDARVLHQVGGPR